MPILSADGNSEVPTVTAKSTLDELEGPLNFPTTKYEPQGYPDGRERLSGVKISQNPSKSA